MACLALTRNNDFIMNESLYAEFLAEIDKHQILEERLQRIVSVVSNRQRGLMLMMENVHNPHNLAAIARSCDALGVQDLAFTMEHGSEFDTDLIDITAVSAFKWLDYRQFTQGTGAALTTLKAEGWHIMATWVNPQARSIYEIDFTQYEKLVLLVGSEGSGLSATAVAMADSFLYIPMQGFIQSFNVSVAAALSLFEITRQRRASAKDFALDMDSARALTKDFLKR
jgi:tRNA (guanosine-2'-O-)-methyltransferase